MNTNLPPPCPVKLLVTVAPSARLMPTFIQRAYEARALPGGRRVKADRFKPVYKIDGEGRTLLVGVHRHRRSRKSREGIRFLRKPVVVSKEVAP